MCGIGYELMYYGTLPTILATIALGGLVFFKSNLIVPKISLFKSLFGKEEKVVIQ